jgi:hypothetical protein
MEREYRFYTNKLGVGITINISNELNMYRK